MTEEWRPILGAEGFYEVSDRGRIRSLDRIDNGGSRRLGRVMKTDARAGQRGYRVVKICAPDGSRRMRYVHDLVLEAFVEPRPPGLSALHWDDDVENNSPSNLRWGTQRENMEDAKRNGGAVGRWTHCTRGHELAPWNLVNTAQARCLACHYARSYARRHGLGFDPEVADLRYAAARSASLREV